MPLPIIILLDRHGDVDSKETLMHALPCLVAAGYDTFCTESPFNLNEQETIDSARTVVSDFEKIENKAQIFLKLGGIQIDDLSGVYYPDLVTVLDKYVTVNKSKEMAFWFKELPGYRKKLALLQEAKRLGMSIHGIDLDATLLQSLSNLHDPAPLPIIAAINPERELSFKHRLMTYHAQGKGIIFSVGQYHYAGLVKAFAQEDYLKHVVFLHPHSIKTLIDTIDDFSLEHHQPHHQLTLLDQAITQPEDGSLFVSKLMSHLLLFVFKTHQLPRAQSLLGQSQLRYVIDVNQTDTKQMTALHYACGYGAMDLAQQLFVSGANLHAKNSMGRTPVDYCMRDENVLSELLLANGLTPLIDDREFIETSLSNQRLLRDWCITQGAAFDWLIRFYAANNRIDELTVLLNYANASQYINVSGQPSGRTALHNAVAKGHVAVIELLLQANASANLGDKDGNTALHLAVFQKNADWVILLMQYGARTDRPNKQKQTVADLLEMDLYGALKEKIVAQDFWIASMTGMTETPNY